MSWRWLASVLNQKEKIRCPKKWTIQNQRAFYLSSEGIWIFPGTRHSAHRGYYMPTWGYEFYLECSTWYLTHLLHSLVRYRVEHKITFISTSGHILFCLLHKHQWKRRDLLCNHNNGDLSLHMWRQEVFAWKLTWCNDLWVLNNHKNSFVEALQFGSSKKLIQSLVVVADECAG